MSEWKQVSQHLRAAQQWLSKAERSFDEQKPIRGELDMMLARAELRRAEETKRGADRQFGRSRYRRRLALIAAGVVLGGGMLWFSHASQPKAQPVMEIVSRSEERTTTFGTVMPIKEDRMIEVRQSPAETVSTSQKGMTDLPRAVQTMHR